MVDVGVALEQFVEPRRGVSGGINRRVLRQLQVDKQLRTIRGREELLRNEAHPIERRCEQTEGDDNRDPTRPHGKHEEAAERTHDRARFFRVRGLGFFEDPNPHQRGKDHGNDP